ncbi:tRNA epoxyqueuosine(34) reductase QueG [Granulicella sibirica]|uniref:Epoxyqueuosine (OQ) reductase QueG n=1 Tax=Granulicella sibirica TaxID=2479048 RepID=A0A4Q0T3J2_9BACT|nr:tRNA epoxyqueuosine(34) reductase QueG [Granulicella sibirica]RXH56121.1 Epoxyqueuosine (oQ) reductase QueG [Granulicella sibirica]
MSLCEWTEGLIAWVKDASRQTGFDVSGVTAADNPIDGARFVDWVEAGRAGEMDWLKRRDERGALVRSAVKVALPWARSVVVCAMNYNAAAPLSLDVAEPGAGWIGRYAWSGRKVGEAVQAVDYHDDLLARLREVEAGLKVRSECETRCYVDTGPLVERGMATKAGIGWVGKNTCVIREGMGSWMLMGVIVTSLPLAETTVISLPAEDRCGSCTRCLEACPTGALVAPREMDASLCIAYLTIEKKGSITEDLREAVGRQVFGCDICQDVCPWNRKAPIAWKQGLETRRELVNPALEWLAQLDSAGFRRVFKGSPLERTGKKRLHRNVAIAMGNSGQSQFIPQLEVWAAGEDAVLAESAVWALGRLRRSGSSEDPVGSVENASSASIG